MKRHEIKSKFIHSKPNENKRSDDEVEKYPARKTKLKEECTKFSICCYCFLPHSYLDSDSDSDSVC